FGRLGVSRPVFGALGRPEHRVACGFDEQSFLASEMACDLIGARVGCFGDVSDGRLVVRPFGVQARGFFDQASSGVLLCAGGGCCRGRRVLRSQDELPALGDSSSLKLYATQLLYGTQVFSCAKALQRVTGPSRI